MNVFLDANVFFAAASSPHGGSGFVFALCAAGAITPITVEYVLFEAERAIRRSLSDGHLRRRGQNVRQSNILVQPLPEIAPPAVALLEHVVSRKDVPVIAGALQAHVDVLVTLDRRHLLGNDLLRKFHLPFEILNPREFLTKYF